MPSFAITEEESKIGELDLMPGISWSESDSPLNKLNILKERSISRNLKAIGYGTRSH